MSYLRSYVSFYCLDICICQITQAHQSQVTCIALLDEGLVILSYCFIVLCSVDWFYFHGIVAAMLIAVEQVIGN